MFRAMDRVALLLASLVLSGCGCSPGVVKPPPGDEVLGTYSGELKGIYSACSLAGFPITDFFEGTFSRFSDGGRVFFLSGDLILDAGFDGQFASFEFFQKGTFALVDGGSCGDCQMKQVQTATLALLSPSQSAAVGDVCPTAFQDGGVPAEDEDAGIFRPRRGDDGGFDAVLACGESVSTITGEGFCDALCYSCKVVYRINSARK